MAKWSRKIYKDQTSFLACAFFAAAALDHPHLYQAHQLLLGVRDHYRSTVQLDIESGISYCQITYVIHLTKMCFKMMKRI